MSNRKLKLVIATLSALFAEILVPVFSGSVQAAAPPQFSSAFVRLDRLRATSPTGGSICAKPTTVATEVDFQVTFPTQTGTDFTVNSTPANWTVSTAAPLPNGGVAWPGINTATAVSGKTVTFPSTDLTVGTLYCFHFSGTNTLTNGTAGASLTGTMHTRDTGNTVIDETNYAVAIVSDDQIVVSAVVPPTFVFALSGNTDGFLTNLDTANVLSTTGRTVSITTNAKGGWIGWVKDSNQGLFSASANYTIPTSGSPTDATPASLTNNSEGYVLDADLTTDAGGGCSVAIDAEYNGVTGVPSVSGGALSGTFQPFASCTGLPPATSNGDVITLVERASIAGSTTAGSDYTDTITVVAAGNF